MVTQWCWVDDARSFSSGNIKAMDDMMESGSQQWFGEVKNNKKKKTLNKFMSAKLWVMLQKPATYIYACK